MYNISTNLTYALGENGTIIDNSSKFLNVHVSNQELVIVLLLIIAICEVIRTVYMLELSVLKSKGDE